METNEFENPMVGIGSKLKKLRQLKGLVLSEVAEQTGLSVGFLSLVENDKANLSFSSLVKVCKAYGVTPSTLLASAEKSAPFLVRREDRVKSEGADGATIEWLTWNRNRKMGVDILHLEPEVGSGGTYTHEGEEFAYILQGTVEFTIGSSTYVLNEGDMVYFEGTIPHEWRNIGKLPASILFGTSPPAI